MHDASEVPSGVPGQAGVRERPVAAVMRRHWIAVEPQASLYEAERLMRLARVRHLPVTEDGVLLGVVAYRRLLAAWIEQCLALSGGAQGVVQVASLMEPPGAAVEPSTPLAVAARAMVEGAVGCVPVVAGGEQGDRLVGLVTEADLLRLAYDPAFSWKLGAGPERAR